MNAPTVRREIKTFKCHEGNLGSGKTALLQKKRSKAHKRLKERFLIGRNRTKRANFRESPLFQATYNRKTEEQTINSTSD